MSAVRPMVRVLGPIDVVRSSGTVAVGGPHRRALLGALTVGAGHAVPIDHLVDVVWGDDPPRSAESTLQSQVSHLRRILGTDAILRVNHSYELSADHVAIDAQRFEQLLQAAHDALPSSADCLQLCRDALGLWRGRPFGEFADTTAFHLEALRLDEQRLNAVELSLRAELELGHAETIVAELEAAVEEQPYRESLWRLLIEALCESDRRVEALRACFELRRTLADVGLTAGAWVTELERAIAGGETRCRVGD